jgi:TolB-like protein/tetratricopeptide (TPR) repeat protein
MGSRVSRLLGELRRRKVIGVGVAYALIGVALIEAADLIFPRLALPDWTVTLVVVLILLGFPLALLLSWAFQVTPEDSTRTGTVKAGRGSAQRDTVAEDRAMSARDSDLLTLPKGPAIAVLPFHNLSGNQEDEFFTDGITEDIITGLTRFTNLFVIARSSTARFRGERVDVREVKRDLGVTYALQGGIRRSADHLRVNAELVDTSTGAHLWAERYDRDLTPGDIFQVLDDITNRVVATLAGAEGVLTRSGATRAKRKCTGSVDAYEAVLRAFSYWDRQTPAEHFEIRDALERGLDLDPEYAPAWACLSIFYLDEYRVGFNPRPEPLDRALKAARRATELDPAGHHAQQALAQVHFYRRERDAFLLAARKAVQLNPNDCTIVAMMGLLTAYAGEWEAGIAMLEKAMALNPYHPGWYYLPLAFHRYRARDYEGALEEALKVDMPGYWPNHMTLAAIYGQLGRPKEAGAALERLLQLSPSFEERAREELGKWLFEREVLEHMLEGLEKAGLQRPLVRA